MNPEQLALAVQILEEFVASPPENPATFETREALEELIEFVKTFHLSLGGEMAGLDPESEVC